MALEYTPGAGGAQQAAVYTPGMAAQGSGNQDPLAMLDGYESVIILQDEPGCCREHLCCCLCAPEKYFRVFAGENEDQEILHFDEESGVCSRCLCLFTRSFYIDIKKPNQDEALLRATRPCMCCTCCSWSECCRLRFRLDDMAENKLGTVSEDCHVCCSCFPSFSVKDPEGQTEFKIEKDINCCQIMCCACCPIKSEYTIENKRDEDGQFGKMHHLPQLRSIHTDADKYRVIFPPGARGLDRFKLLSTVVLVDYALDAPDEQAMS